MGTVCRERARRNYSATVMIGRGRTFAAMRTSNVSRILKANSINFGRKLRFGERRWKQRLRRSKQRQKSGAAEKFYRLLKLGGSDNLYREGTHRVSRRDAKRRRRPLLRHVGTHKQQRRMNMFEASFVRSRL